MVTDRLTPHHTNMWYEVVVEWDSMVERHFRTTSPWGKLGSYLTMGGFVNRVIRVNRG